MGVQTGVVCIVFLPTALDEFCLQLKRFKRAKPNEAILHGTAVLARRGCRFESYLRRNISNNSKEATREGGLTA